MDLQVYRVQAWLNETYGGVAGWVTLDVDGITGWATIYGLRRALQSELGISPVSSGFGDATTAAFVSQVGTIDETTTSENLLLIISGALWCKGYSGLFSDAQPQFAGLEVSVATMLRDLGLSDEAPYLDVKLMASLLSMDAYRKVLRGQDTIRAVQKWLNAIYLHRRDFTVVPCDGVYSRQTQKALLFALQYEFGMAEGTANGNFGPGTKAGLASSAVVRPGSVDGSTHFVRLAQAALVFNDFPGDVTGRYEQATTAAVQEFQDFMELPVTGAVDYPTWCALLVSSGDTGRATTGCDTRQQLTLVGLRSLNAAGYSTVGRYLVGAGKFITPTEVAAFATTGTGLVPLHQRYNDSVLHMTRANGQEHAREAVQRARLLGVPSGSVIYFAVDFDAQDDALGAIRTYFEAVRDHVASYRLIRYEVGIYATRNICSAVIDAGLATDAYVSGMSNGYSGNMGFRMPERWRYSQVVEQTFSGSGGAFPIDKVAVSKHAGPVLFEADALPPPEFGWASTATGYDAVYDWVVAAETALDLAQPVADGPLNSLCLAIPNYLRKRNADYRELAWDAFFTPLMSDPALATLESRMDALGLGEPNTRYKALHFAAAFLGYETWGRATSTARYCVGDMAGWLMDLLWVFGRWESSGQDLATFTADAVGQSDIFVFEDLIADADAYLCAQPVAHSDGTWSGRFRAGWQQLRPQDRIRRFMTGRFADTAASVESTLASFVSDVERLGVLGNVSVDLVEEMAGASRLPVPSEVAALAQGFLDAVHRVAR